MLPDMTAVLGRGICRNHGLGDLSSRLIPKDCPECGQFGTVEEHRRCAECAVKQNRCAICDGLLTTLKVYVCKTSSRYLSMGVYILLASSLEEARNMFLEKMKQDIPGIEVLEASQLFSEWQIEERELVKGFIHEYGGVMMGNPAREED